MVASSCGLIIPTLIGSRALAASGDVDGSSAANNRPWSRTCTAKLFGSVIKIVNLCFDVVPPRVDGQYFAMGDVAISLINITHMRDALSKGQVINEAETP